MTPQTRAFGALMRRPIVRIDAAPAPAVFEQEFRRRPGIERGHVIVDMAAERGADHFRLALREIVSLSDIVEITQLHHQVMDAGLAGVEKRQTVMACIEVEEIGREWSQNVVAR